MSRRCWTWHKQKQRVVIFISSKMVRKNNSTRLMFMCFAYNANYDFAGFIHPPPVLRSGGGGNSPGIHPDSKLTRTIAITTDSNPDPQYLIVKRILTQNINWEAGDLTVKGRPRAVLAAERNEGDGRKARRRGSLAHRHRLRPGHPAENEDSSGLILNSGQSGCHPLHPDGHSC